MAESAARSSTTSATSAAKLRASKKSAKASRRSNAPDFSWLFRELARVAELSTVERKLRDRGFRLVAGTDEVGRGALAGPVVAAAVVLDRDPTLLGVNDSKLLDSDDRAAICRQILARARAVAVGVVEPHIIDTINILRASKQAMRLAVQDLALRPEALVLDAVVIDSLEMPQLPVIQGDRRCISVAAASVVAKVYRDTLMRSYHDAYPEFDFAHNRGYGTENHLQALARFGPTPIHRKSFLGLNRNELLFEQMAEDGGPAR